MGKILRGVYAAEDVSLSEYESHMHTLEAWSLALPQNLRYQGDHLTQDAAPYLSPEEDVASVRHPQPRDAFI